MLTGIDHLVIAVPDPDAAAALLERDLGLRAGGGGRHDRLGTFNRLVWLGDAYLELIGVFDEALAGSSWLGEPTLRALRDPAGTGLATWSVATDDIAADVELLRGRGTDFGDPIPGERVRPDGRTVRWRLATPRRLGPLEAPFLIEHDPEGAEWTADERAARAAERHPVGGAVRLATLELPVPETARSSARYLAAGIGPFRPSLAGRGARDATIGRTTLRLTPARADDPTSWPVPTVHLAVEREPAAPASSLVERELLGCRWIVR